MVNYMPLKFPRPLRQPLLNKQNEMNLQLKQLLPGADIVKKPIPFTKVFKAMLENKTWIPNDYLVRLYKEDKWPK